MKTIPYGRQNIDKEDIQAVIEVLKSDFLTQGPTIELFEKTIVDYCGVHYATAVNSATSALHLGCLALGLGPEDLVWTSPISFVASANCALYCGAKIDFVDIDYNTNNMSVSALKDKLESAEKVGALPSLVIVVHMGGLSCDMKAIWGLSEKYGFKVIEDASHAIGAKYLDQMVGCCQFSDLTIFSFHPVKIVTTGEGGAAVTNNYELDRKLKLLRSHGVTRDPNQMVSCPDGDWYYQQIELGYNYRMTDIQSALGVSQMKRLNDFVETRNKLADNYHNHLSSLELDLPLSCEQKRSSYHLYIIKLRESCNQSRQTVFDYLRFNHVGVNVHYIPIHLHPYYLNLGFKRGYLPEAERYYEQALSIPLHPNLSNEEQSYVIEKIRDVLA